MTLYRPPLLLKNQTDRSTHPLIEDALQGLKHAYFYSGKRLGNSDNIELEVTTIIFDNSDNLFLRSCNYTGQKHTWKEVIKEQLVKHLLTLDVEKGIVNSETRYFEVTPEYHLPKEKYENELLNYIAKVNRKRNENNSI